MENTITKSLHQVSEVVLSYRSLIAPSQRPKVSSSKDAVDVLRAHWDISRIEFQEQFKVLLLNRANKAIGICEISTGGVSGTVADPKLIFAAALKACASSIIVAHNHPSGNLSPSQSDIDLTRKLKEGGKLLEIQMLDHVILTVEGYYSFAYEGQV
ncbi:MAG: JAB domain-containing protein [Cyclobacteriaceae bacterium]|nr:JAB domain-containing protein [Cyclobacteriaceae bacterium]